MHPYQVFLGSSSESKWLAKEIEGAFSGDKTIEIDAWYHFGTWPPGEATLETLENRLSEADFAILVLSEDDLVQSRNDPPRPAARDNVIFELGLFMGRLGRNRAFFFFPDGKEFKLASDLFGITALPYSINDREKAQKVISPLCSRIEKQINQVAKRQLERDLRVRPKLEPSVHFPKDDGKVDDGLRHLSVSDISIMKIWASIDDDTIDEFRVCFDTGLHMQKSAWTYKLDENNRRCYWAAMQQLNAMKRGDGFISFDINKPRRGKHEVDVVALSNKKQKYSKKFIIEAS